MKLALASCLITFAACQLPSQANVSLAPMFTDNMVLQRDKPLTIWGNASPGERVTVTIGAGKKTALTPGSGQWRVVFAPLKAGRNIPFIVTGRNKLALKNVAVGDVWLCGGQSNMRWPLTSPVAASEDIEGADAPEIRLLMIPQKVAGTPQREFGDKVEWKVCTPQNAIGFSKVSYYFARRLQQDVKAPIGLINAACNGSVAQAWMSPQSLLKRDDLRAAAQQAAIQIGPPGRLEARVENWWKENDLGTRESWQRPAVDDGDWPETAIAGAWSNNSLGNLDGVLWLRQSVDIPPAWAGKDLVFRLGAIDDEDSAYFNGQLIGRGYGWNLPRVYKIPAAMVKAGRATIAIRVLDIFESGGFSGNGLPSLQLAGYATQRIRLGVNWKSRATTPAGDLPPWPEIAEGNPDQPAALFNGMIAPLVPFGLRGVLWYQGESNVADPVQYRTLFPELIRDWRNVFGAKQDGSEFGFFFVQLANYMAPTELPVQSGCAELREAQAMALSLPRTGMATAIDIGEAGDIHPRNKEDVGKRLALAALAVEYGRKIEYSGPVFRSLRIQASSARLTFAHAAGLKTSDGSPPRSFAISGADGVWHQAEARIVGETIVVSSPNVPSPVAVRYAWANNPAANLINDAGLPAVPFRTDSP